MNELGPAGPKNRAIVVHDSEDIYSFGYTGRNPLTLWLILIACMATIFPPMTILPDLPGILVVGTSGKLAEDVRNLPRSRRTNPLVKLDRGSSVGAFEK